MASNNQFGWEEVERFTKNFSKENLIDNIQFGQVYRGRKQGKVVTVKLLDNTGRFGFYSDEMTDLVKQELAFLELQRSSPFFAKAIGYSLDLSNERLAVVYDLVPIGTLHNLLKADALDWGQRMRLALNFAHSLEIMHSNNCYVHNIDPAHIIIDQDYNPLLIEFSSMESAILGGKLPCGHFVGSPGYMDPYGSECGYADREDVFAFAVVLISLISKKIWDMEMVNVYNEPFLYEWARSKERTTSLVDESFQGDESFDVHDGLIVSELVLQCASIMVDPCDRPTMSEVVSSLKSLSIFSGC